MALINIFVSADKYKYIYIYYLFFYSYYFIKLGRRVGK